MDTFERKPGTFLSLMGFEIRGQLGTIDGYATLIYEGLVKKPTGSLQTSDDKLRIACEKLLNSTRGILELDKVSRAYIQVKLNEAELPEWLDPEDLTAWLNYSPASFILTLTREMRRCNQEVQRWAKAINTIPQTENLTLKGAGGRPVREVVGLILKNADGITDILNKAEDYARHLNR